MIPPGMIRAGPFVVLPQMLTEYGVDPAAVLSDAGLEPAMLSHTETTLPYRAVARLLALCAERTGCAHFGLRAGQRTGIGALGVLGLMMQNSANVRAAWQLLASKYGAHDTGGTLILRADPVAAAIGYQPTVPVRDTTQVVDYAIAVGVQIMRSLCGPDWQPLEALLARPRPADVQPYMDLIRSPLRFDAAVSLVLFHPAFLDQRIPTAQPELLAALKTFSGSSRLNVPVVLGDEVRRMLRQRVTRGDTSLSGVAAALGVTPHALSRRLTETGCTFKELVSEIRHETARQLLEQTSMPVGRIAELLGYTDQASFTRAFRDRAGMPPNAWRVRRREI